MFIKVVNNIFHGKSKRVDELAHDYHFSESTFRRILAQYTPILKSYGLKWQLNPTSIEGNEANLRKFFKDFYYEGADTKYTLVPDKALHELVLDKLHGIWNWIRNDTGRFLLYVLYCNQTSGFRLCYFESNRFSKNCL